MFRLIGLPAAAAFIFFISGCGNSDGWVSRQWHNTNAHYNIFFNAEQTWNSTMLTLREGYKDDYRTFIELYNYGSAESLKANQGTMDEVVKKTSTLIDKHPKSKWVDDSYLLMGKAYFLKGDFFAAKDIFEFVNSSFKDPVIQYRSRLWIFQCLYFQGKMTEAENLIVSLKNDKEFPAKLAPELNKALGAVYLRNNKPTQAAEHLLLSLNGMKGKMERYRLHFALAQALQQNQKYDEAEFHYAKVVKMNPPYDIAFNARVNQVEILSLQKKDYAKANTLLKRMLRDDKNIEYFGQIYYRMGINELRAGNAEKGLQYLNLSLRNSDKDKAQSTTTYLALGDYFYENRDFERSGLYYDSANMFLDEKHPDYKNISRRSLLLSELLRHLITIKKQDSLLRLAADPVLRERTIDKLIEAEKNQVPKDDGKPGTPATTFPGGDPNSAQNMGSFPFYNPTSRARGAAEFQKYWGNRSNRDFWRLNSKQGSGSKGSGDRDTADTKDTSGGPGLSVAENRKRYYKEIPMTPESQKEANEKIETALMGAAGVYQNSFGEPASAVYYYKELLRRYPNTKFEAQALYEIAKIARTAGNLAEYEQYRQTLTEKYPESVYLKLLDDPNAATKISDQNPVFAKKEIQELYEKMYEAYRAGSYDEAMAIKFDADKRFAGNVLQAKFDYLAALCTIKQGKTEAGIEKLKQVVIDYPDTPEAEEAQATVDIYYKRLNPEPVVSDTGSKSGAAMWQGWDGSEELFFILVYQRGANSNLLRAGLNDFNKENFIFEKLEVGSVQTSGETVYLSVYNFSTSDVCRQYVKFLTEKPDFFASRGLFEYDLAWITKTNYQTLVKNNLINNYLDHYKSTK